MQTDVHRIRCSRRHREDVCRLGGESETRRRVEEVEEFVIKISHRKLLVGTEEEEEKGK
tara:strand:+ start:135 stop:311 length:177 start_codon:yes stop_codon:yes gene_type:complete